jgi:malate synthase
MNKPSVPLPIVIVLVVVTSAVAAGAGYMWANSKKVAPAVAPQAGTPYVYIPSLDAPALIKLAPDVFATLESRCKTKEHPTCDTLKSDAVRKARLSGAGDAKPAN